MSEQELVKKCLAEICARIGLEPSTLSQRSYEYISQEIEEATNTLISVSTIKRLLHGEFSRMPQTATLNAISAYLGFKNWQEYRTLHNGHISDSPVSIQPPVAPLPVVQQSIFSRYKWAGLAVIVAGILATLGFIGFSSQPPHHYEKAQFSAVKTTVNALPNTVIFHYDIDAVNADSFFIQQSWDKNRRVRIRKGTHTLTDIYYEPGYHIAKLIANDSVIRTFDISIPTDRWFLYSRDLPLKGLPQYIRSNPFKKGYLGIDPADLDSNRIEINTEKLYALNYFPSAIHVSSDNYVFRATVRTHPVRQEYCPFVMYEVFGQRNFMYFLSRSIGCASESSAQYGETIINGKQTDLSSLCTDATQWTTIEVMVKNKQVSILINNKKVFSTSYTASCGNITGLGFFSNGLCEIKQVELKGLDGEIVYKNDL